MVRGQTGPNWHCMKVMPSTEYFNAFTKPYSAPWVLFQCSRIGTHLSLVPALILFRALRCLAFLCTIPAGHLALINLEQKHCLNSSSILRYFTHRSSPPSQQKEAVLVCINQRWRRCTCKPGRLTSLASFPLLWCSVRLPFYTILRWTCVS